jgi:hypothetical protein
MWNTKQARHYPWGFGPGQCLHPGDPTASDTPGAVFEVHLRNDTKVAQTGTPAFSLPGFAGHQSGMDFERNGPGPK